jgi:hypothetical protein
MVTCGFFLKLTSVLAMRAMVLLGMGLPGSILDRFVVRKELLGQLALRGHRAILV